MVQNKQVIFWIFLIATDGLGLTHASNKCGFLPNQIYLKRGERKQLVFWTDQNYDNTEAPASAVENTDDKIDIFLQAVNGGVPKPGVQTEETDQENGPQFISPSTTTTTTTTTEQVVVEETTTPKEVETTTTTPAEIEQITTAQEVTSSPHIETTTEKESQETTLAPVQDEEHENNLESVFPTAVDPDSNGESIFFVSSQESQNVAENEILTVIIGETEAPQEAATTIATPEVAEVQTQVQTQTEVPAEAPLVTEAPAEVPVQTEDQTEVPVQTDDPSITEPVTTQPEEVPAAQPEETTANSANAESPQTENVNQEESGVTENVTEQIAVLEDTIAAFVASNVPEEVVNPELPLAVQETTQSTISDANEESNEQTTLLNEPESISNESGVTTQATVQVPNLVNESQQEQQTEETTTTAPASVQEETQNEEKTPVIFSASEILQEVPQALPEATTESSNEETVTETATEAVLETKDEPSTEESNKAGISETTDSPRQLSNENVQEETTTLQAPVKIEIPQEDSLNADKSTNDETAETVTAADENPQSNNLNESEIGSETTVASEVESTTLVERLNIPQDDVPNDPAPSRQESVETTTTAQSVYVPQDDILNDPAPIVEELIESVTTVNKVIIPQASILNDAPPTILEEIESSTNKNVVSLDQVETTTVLVQLNNVEIEPTTESESKEEPLIVKSETTTNAGLERDAGEATTVESVKMPIEDLDTKAISNQSEERTTLKIETEEIVKKEASEGDSATVPSIADDQDAGQKVEVSIALREDVTTETIETKEAASEASLKNGNVAQETTVAPTETQEEFASEKAETVVNNEIKKEIKVEEATSLETRAESETTVAPVVYQLKEEIPADVSSTTVPVTTTTVTIADAQPEAKISLPGAEFKNNHIFEDTTIAFPEQRPLIEASVVEDEEPFKGEAVAEFKNNHIFEDTTIAFPEQRPLIEASVVEEEEPFKGEPVADEAAKVEAVNPQEETANKGEKIFDETTIAFPIEEEKNIWAPAPNPDDPKTDENGFLIETSTGNGNLNRVAAVHEVVRKSGRHPVKQATSGEETVNDLQESKAAKDGDDITTTLVSVDDEVTTLPTEVNVTASAAEDAKEDESVPFPVTDLLNGIYKFVSSYIKPKPAVKQEVVEKATEQKVQPKVQQVAVQEEEEYKEDDEAEIEAFSRPTIIGPQPLNGHTIPRDQLIVEAVDEEHSNSDPFFQMAAPNLRDNVPPEHITDADNSANAILFPKPLKAEPPRTLSPFNSPALTVQEPPKTITRETDNSLASPLPLSAPIERLGLPAGYLDEVEELNDNAPPLPFLPGNFLRGAPEQPRPLRDLNPNHPQQQHQQQQPKRPAPNSRLSLGSQVSHSRDPVFIPIPDLVSGVKPGQRMLRRQGSIQDLDPVDQIRSAGRKFMGFLDDLPFPMKGAFLRRPSQQQQRRHKRDESEELVETGSGPSKTDSDLESIETTTDSNAINCNWNIKTENGLYLLVTFHNLSAPYTVDCEGAYIEVERENNGFEARWCGNRVTKGGSRPHVIFAKNEVRITVFDNGQQEKELPTGFAADVEVIDLFDGQQYSNLRKTNAYSSVRKLVG